MHDPLENLNLLLQHAAAARDAALQALRRAESTLGAASRQSEELGQYRDQFSAHWFARFRSGGSATLAQCHQDFGQRLEQAISLQQAQLRQAQARFDAARARLLEREQRVASVRKLIERRMLDARRVTEKREQRTTDEAAQRAPRVHPYR